MVNTPISQTILTFPSDSVCTFANLVVGEGNRRATTAVQALLKFSDSECVTHPVTGLILTGEEGTGKTHLLQAAVHACRAISGETSAIYLDTNALHEQLKDDQEYDFNKFLERYGACRLVAVDDLEKLESSAILQEGILYLFNWMRSAGGRLLVAGRRGPQKLEGLRPDLRSRLLWGEWIVLDPPEDEMLGAILAKMVKDRQVRCSSELLKFLQLRLPRYIPDYALALDRLNEAGLVLKRPLTVPLAKEVLGL